MKQLVFQNQDSGLLTRQRSARSEATLSDTREEQMDEEAPAGTDTPISDAPQTQIEQTLAEIWCKVLEIHQVNIHQNFFYLGGDALRSLQVHCMALEKGLHFSLPSFYKHPTIYELAQVLLPA